MGLQDDVDNIRRGAFLAKDPYLYEQVARDRVNGVNLPVKLSSKEKAALKGEKDFLLRQSRDLYITLVTCSAAALVQGWDQTGSNTANLFWPQEFGLAYHQDPDDWLIGQSHTAAALFALLTKQTRPGLVNAAPYIFSALIGCVIAEPINVHFGRRGTIFFAGLWCFASVIGSAFTYSWGTLFATRVCLGIGMGCKAATVAVYAAEAAPAYFRGSIVMSWQVWVATGIFLGFTASLIVYRAGSIAWRLMVGSACIPAIPLLILVYIGPESPRWYMKKATPKHYQKALKAMTRLRNTPLQACRDFYFMHKQLQHERMYFPQHQNSDLEHGALRPAFSRLGNYFVRLGQLFATSRIRRASLAACTIMLAQQLCGINVLAFYSSTLFSHADSNIRDNLLYSWGFGGINALFALPAVRTIDVFGRRPLLLLSLFSMFVTLLAAGFCFQIPTDNPARIGPIALFLFLFAAAYSPGVGPVPFTYSAEAFPLSHREMGMGLAVAVNLFFAGVLTVVFPRLDTALGDTGTLGLFAGFNVLAFIMIFLWVPETANRTLEELSQIFAVPTTKHMAYQFNTFVPWIYRSWIRRQDIELKPLYQEDTETVSDAIDPAISHDPKVEGKAGPLPVDITHEQTVNTDSSRHSSVHD